MAHDAIITVELVPRGAKGELRLDDFLEQMQAIKSALRETERFISGNEPSLYFRIQAMHKNSPSHTTLEAVSEDIEKQANTAYASHVLRTMTTNLRVISKRRRRPRRVDVPVLESYRKMAAPAEKYDVDVKIQSGSHSVLIDRKFREIVDSIVGEDEYSYGSVSGMIEGINIHERSRRFWLYPTVGASRVIGTFRTRDRGKFAQTVDKYVTVYGRLSYKSWDKFPYAIHADDVIIHDLPEHGIQDLKGMAPDATGSLNSREFIDELRDEW